MAKHTSKEAYFQRLQNLANVNKPSLKESKSRNLGSLIDYKRAADGVAYGIVKENHSYFLKKAGTKQDPNVADFAYIGGMENITGYQYKSLSEADKQRNMIFHTINEAITMKPDKNGSKKKRLHEDVASDEIDQAASKLGDLDAATSAEAIPAPAPEEGGMEGSAEMSAGMDAKPEDETPAPENEIPADAPAPEGGEIPALGGEEEVAPEEEMGGEEEVAPYLGGEEGGEPDVAANTDGSIDEPNRELEKAIGKIANKIRKTDMEDAQVKSYINSYLAAFKDKLRDIDIEDRKEMANKILKVVGQDEIDDLGDSIPQDDAEGTELGPEAGLGDQKGSEEEVAEEQCVECGGFGKYAESRGYGDPQSFMECDDEEKANVISGYANAHNDGQNDGDFKTIAIVITPEILEKLKADYGHEDFANQVEPMANEMNESSDEDKMAELNELWGGLASAGKKIGGAIGGGLKSAGNAVADKAKSAYNAGAEKVGQAKDAVVGAAQGVKQAYNAGEVPAEVKKLEGVAANLGKQIDALNKRMVAAGKQPIDVKNILKAVSQQVTGKGAGIGALAEDTAVDPGNTVVSEPNMLKETEKVAPGNKVVSEPNMLKEDDEIEDTDEVGTDGLDGEEIGGEESKVDIGFAPDAQTLGVAGSSKAGGAGLDINISPDKTVNITMNESEVKLRKYVRARLEEKAGLRKPRLTESKKSPALKKLDAVIDQQYSLYESVIAKKKGNVNEVFGFSVKEKLAKTDPNDAQTVEGLFREAFSLILSNPQMGAVARAASKTPTAMKFEILKQYAEQGGGTLRVSPEGMVQFAPKAVQSAATKSGFGGGGTLGHTVNGGV